MKKAFSRDTVGVAGVMFTITDSTMYPLIIQGPQPGDRPFYFTRDEMVRIRKHLRNGEDFMKGANRRPRIKRVTVTPMTTEAAIETQRSY